MSYTTTTRLGLQKAVIGSNQPFETSSINGNWDKVEAEAVATDTRLDNIETLNTTQNGRLTSVEARATKIENEPIRTVSLTTDTLLTTDVNSFVVYNSASSTAVTIPSVLVAGQRIDIIQYGVGGLTFTAGSGVTLRGGTGMNIQYAGATVVALSSTEYVIIGNVVV
jgi:hypothetical protein